MDNPFVLKDENIYKIEFAVDEANILVFYLQGSKYLEFKKILGFVDSNKNLPYKRTVINIHKI